MSSHDAENVSWGHFLYKVREVMENANKHRKNALNGLFGKMKGSIPAFGTKDRKSIHVFCQTKN